MEYGKFRQITGRIEGPSSRSHGSQFRPITGSYGKFWPIASFHWPLVYMVCETSNQEPALPAFLLNLSRTSQESVFLGSFSLNQSGASMLLDQSEVSVYQSQASMENSDIFPGVRAQEKVRAWNFSKSQGSYEGGEFGNFPSPSDYMKGPYRHGSANFNTSTYFFIFLYNSFVLK